jgi:hypothetical protein
MLLMSRSINAVAGFRLHLYEGIARRFQIDTEKPHCVTCVTA